MSSFHDYMWVFFVFAVIIIILFLFAVRPLIYRLNPKKRKDLEELIDEWLPEVSWTIIISIVWRAALRSIILDFNGHWELSVVSEIVVDAVILTGTFYVLKSLTKRFGAYQVRIVSVLQAPLRDIMEDLENLEEEKVRRYIDASRRFRDLPSLVQQLNGITSKQTIDVVKHQLKAIGNSIGTQEYEFFKEQYVEFLKMYVRRGYRLYCINKTPPIEWFSPHPSELDFVFNYYNLLHKKGLQVVRVTVVENAEDLLKDQVSSATRKMSALPDINFVSWFLILLASLFDKRRELPASFLGIFESYSKLLENILASSWPDLDIVRRELSTFTFDDVQDLKKKIFNELSSSEVRFKLTRTINRKFNNKFGNDGSNWISRKAAVKDVLPPHVRDAVTGKWELGIFLDDEGNVAQAFESMEEGGLVRVTRKVGPEVIATLDWIRKTHALIRKRKKESFMGMIK